ncbi:MAG TPA: Stp1/IreP family PP2C-type Ser/Thr phosphatase [Rhodocyclaceae bacterium]|nr:Stp1/IreP family PP2C-type Ser/Thr phosphatase [Rhodocyclaceae bacterium]
MTAPAGSGAASTVAFAARSDVGRVRTRNEDVVDVDARRGWALLADGMGGHHGGDVAARLAVDTLADRLASGYRPGWRADAIVALLAEAVQAANDEIRRAAARDAALASMGTTLVAAVWAGAQVVCAHVGDSRLYRQHAGRFARLTRDHSVVQDQLDAGLIDDEQARHSPFRGMLTRGIGVDVVVTPEIARHDARPGDRFLLCSDGLTDMLRDDEIAALLAAPGSPDAIAASLVDAANRGGGRDNISVVVALVAI